MYLFYALLLVIPMFFLRKRTAESGEILDAKSTTCLKGLLCFFVMLHNLGLDLPGNTVIKERICEYSGGIGVGLFFFLSAFGIIRSYQRKGNGYLKRLLLVHIPKLYLISVGINLLTYFVFFQGAFETGDLLMRIFNLDFFNGFQGMNRHGWYIASIITMYLVFALVYFVCSKLKTEKRFMIAGIVLAFLAIAFRLTAIIADEGRMYTRELPTFAIGCIYATFYQKINEWAKKFFWAGLFICIPLFILGFIIKTEAISTYTAAVLIILVSQKCTYYNRVGFFFGKICIGVYLFLYFSTLAFGLGTPYMDMYNDYWWVLLNAGFIIELSVLLYGVEYVITKGIRFLADRRLSGKEIKERAALTETKTN